MVIKTILHLGEGGVHGIAGRWAGQTGRRWLQSGVGLPFTSLYWSEQSLAGGVFKIK